MASAAAAFSARFRRGQEAPKAAARVGEILSDSSDGSELAEAPERRQGERRARSDASSSESRVEPKAAPASARRSRQAKRSGSRKWYSDSDSGEEGGGPAASLKRPEGSAEAAPARSSAEPSAAEAGEAKASDAAGEPLKDGDQDGEKQSDSIRALGKDGPKLKRLIDVTDERKDTNAMDTSGGQILSPLSDSDMPLAVPAAPPQLPGKKQSSFQKLMAKTKTLSPFAARSKALDAASAPATPAAIGSRSSSMASEIHNENRPSSASMSENPPEPTIPSRAQSTSGSERSISQRRGSKLQVTTTDLEKPKAVGSSVVSSDGPPMSGKSNASEVGGQTPMPIINRRTSRLKQSPSHSDYSGGGNNTPRNEAAQPVAPMEVPVQRTFSYETPDSMSPGQRKQPGAFPGHPGSGVILEGWLRQKQRRGMKGMKKWNSRYFVLYAKTNEIRYYADVVPSAWGPIPLGEIGSISLRLIQRIGKPSHPKYKGCRFDITCRNTWGTHYADDYVSSDDENNNEEPNNNNNNNAANGKTEKSGTPKSSRVYSLIADSPQVTVTWVNVLDSMLVRSANSPRPDVNSPGVSGNNKMKKVPPSKAISRRRSSALDMETVVLYGPGESVPSAVNHSIHYIFNSSPGVETPHFYELDADPAKLKAALKFLNRYAEGDSAPAQKPTKEELAEVLDPVTAGGIVKMWLRQLEQPLVPFEMYADFKTVAVDAAVETFDLSRNLKALLGALPAKNRSMLGSLLFHLNDVNAYASANEMDAALLAKLFADYILRPRTEDPGSESARTDVEKLVVEMIAHVDSYIDESEIEGQT